MSWSRTLLIFSKTKGGLKMGKRYDTIVCNFFAGPGTGKSTMAAAVFATLKWRGVDCEIATEYAKDKVWEESTRVLGCQSYVFGKQLFRLYRLNSKVQLVLTDSPILLSPIYDKKKSRAFLAHVVEQFNEFRNYNIFLKRIKKYNPNGRMQTLDEAKEKDRETLNLLKKLKVPFTVFDGSKKSVKKIADILEKMVDENKK